MLFLLVGTSFCRLSADLFSFANIANISLQMKGSITNPFQRTPYYVPIASSLSHRLTLFKSEFSRLSMPLIHGNSISMQVHSVRFSNCASPIRIESAAQTSINKRRSFSNSELDLDNTLYEFCHALNSDGGCLYLSDCTATMSSSFFFQGLARNGGGACIVGGRLTVSDTTFVKCQAKTKGGAVMGRDVSIRLSRTKLVGNKAGVDSGALALIHSDTYMLDVVCYQNTAKLYGGMSFDGVVGQVIQAYFKGNTASSKEGTSLSVENNIDYLCIEGCNFYDVDPYPVRISGASATRIVDGKFTADAANGIYVVLDTEVRKCDIINPQFWGAKMDKEPTLPAGMMREVLSYNESEPMFAWRSLYMLIAVFAVGISLLIIFIPIVILPGQADEGWVKQNLTVAEPQI